MQHSRQVLRQRERRAIRVRNRVKRDASRPRLVIFRSHQNIYAQIIDDAAGKTLVSASSRDQGLRGDLPYGGNKTAAIAGAPVGVVSGLKIDLTKLFGGGDAMAMAARERDTELVRDGREAVGMAVGMPKRQEGKEAGPKDELDSLMDALEDLEI